MDDSKVIYFILGVFLVLLTIFLYVNSPLYHASIVENACKQHKWVLLDNAILTNDYLCVGKGSQLQIIYRDLAFDVTQVHVVERIEGFDGILVCSGRAYRSSHSPISKLYTEAGPFYEITGLGFWTECKEYRARE